MKTKTLKDKRVWFTFKSLVDGDYVSTGIVIKHIPEENCLTVKDNRDGCHYYVSKQNIK